MAIEVDALANSGAKDNQSTWAWNHTCSGADRILVVSIGKFLGNITAVTYNEAPLALQASTFSASHFSYIYYLVNPPTGEHEVKITFDAGSYGVGGSISLTGVDTGDPIDNSETAATDPDADNISLQIVTSEAGSFLIDSLKGDDLEDNGVVLASQTLRYHIETLNGNNAGQSTKPAVSADTYTMGWDSFDVVQRLAYVVVAVKALEEAGFENKSDNMAAKMIAGKLI